MEFQARNTWELLCDYLFVFITLSLNNYIDKIRPGTFAGSACRYTTFITVLRAISFLLWHTYN